MPTVEHFVALEGTQGRLARLRSAARRERRPASTRPAIAETRPARRSTTRAARRRAQGRDDHAPQRLDERGRHAGPLADDAGGPLPVDAADVPRQRLDVHVDRDGASARRTSACGRSEPAAIYRLVNARAASRMLCAAPTVLIAHRQRPGGEQRKQLRRGVRVHHGRRAAGRRDDRAHRGRARLDDHAGLRPHRDGAVHHDLRAAARARRALPLRAGAHQGAAGRRADHVRRAAGRRRSR